MRKGYSGKLTEANVVMGRRKDEEQNLVGWRERAIARERKRLYANESRRTHHAALFSALRCSTQF